MKSNFEFLKNKNKKLFNIMDDAEKLYRDGYFEQTIAQTRKFGEIVAKNILGVRRTTEETFDDFLATLKDIMGENPMDKELIDDLYFLKKQGNLAVHDSATEQGGTVALECLQRAFEVSINFAVKLGQANKKILNSHYSIDLLMTGREIKPKEKYQKIREEALKEGVEELADFAQNKVQKVDFKNKKKIEDKKPKKVKEAKKKTPKKKEKAEEKENKKAEINLFPYVTIGGILFILFICIMLFILPL